MATPGCTVEGLGLKSFAKEIIKHAIECAAEAFAQAAGGHLAERLFTKDDDKPVVKSDDPATVD